jgi:hypothetical protein
MDRQQADPRLRLRGLKDVAEILGTDWRNVREWVESGELRCVRVGDSGEPKVSLLMLEAWQSRPTQPLAAPRRRPR